jgi:secondary thiamine-phosphate synthase enzyme
MHERTVRVTSEELSLHTSGENDILDITDEVSRAVSSSGLTDGVAIIFVQGSTAAVTTLEYERGLLKDLPMALERIAPKGELYEHEKAWHDGNGHSHVRSAVVGTSLTVPFMRGRLVLGTWQQIVLVEMDVRPRDRRVIVQLLGE